MYNNKYDKIFFINIAFIISCLWMISASFFSGYTNSIAIFNADAIYIPTLVTDILYNGGSLFDWKPPPAPYYFPDAFIFTVSYLLGHNAVSQIIISAVIQTFLTFSIIFFLIKKMDIPNPLSIAVITLILLVSLALFKDNIPDQFMASIFAHIFVLSFHYGSFISLLLFVTHYIYFDDLKNIYKQITIFFIICLIAFFAGLSDKTFIAHAAVPFFVARLIADILFRNFSVARKILPLVPVLSSYSGMKIYETFFTKARPAQPYWPDLDLFLKRCVLFYSRLTDIIVSAPVYGVILFIYLGIVIHVFYRLIFQKKSPNTKLDFLIIFSFISILTVIVSTLLVTVSKEGIHARYMIPLYFLPSIVSVIYFGYYFGYRFIKTGMLVSFIVIIYFCQNLVIFTKSNKLEIAQKSQFPIYTNLFSCIEDALIATGARNGMMTNYWHYQPFTLFSKLDLNISLHSGNDFHPVKWITSEKHYKSNYDFISFRLNIANKGWYKNFVIDNEAKPLFKKLCDGQQYLLIYEKDQLKARKFYQDTSSIHTDFFWKGCEIDVLHSSIFNDKCQLKILKAAEYNPRARVQLPIFKKGKYSIYITYSSTEAKSNFAGKWNISLFPQAESITLAENIISGTDSEIKVSKTEFYINQDYAFKDAVLSFFSEKNKTFTIDSIAIKESE